MADHWTSRHRGPFKFYVSRAGKNPSAWLAGPTDAEDVDAEAQALLDDARDCIWFVGVWSVRDHQFVHSYKKERAA
ncbi:MAG TPA: hypothetical protein VFN64_09595 [Burkholderiaceae bacterium]|nr:hypothetical protein [Burkholderiaceae bacterium]